MGEESREEVASDFASGDVGMGMYGGSRRGSIGRDG